MMKIVAAIIRIIRRSRMGDARGCWVCFSWYWVFCVVVVSCCDICFVAVKPIELTAIFHSIETEEFWLEERRCTIEGNGTDLHYGDEIEVRVSPLKEEYHMDERVDLVATPAEGWRFAGWHSRYWQDCSRETSVDIYRDMTIEARFVGLREIRAEALFS